LAASIRGCLDWFLSIPSRLES